MSEENPQSKLSLDEREAKVAAREKELQKKQEALIQREEVQKKKEEAPKGSDLDRKTQLDEEEAKAGKRPKRLWVFLLIIAAIVGVMVLIYRDKKAEGLAQEEETFEVTHRRAPVVPPNSLPIPEDTTPEVQPDPDAEKKAALLEARLKSPMLVYSIKGKNRAQANASQEALAASDPNRQFQQDLQKVSVPVSQAVPLGNLQTRILQGKVIDATLETAIHSDLPGMVRAMVSYNVYGESGRQVLIPKGSRLIGEYNSSIRKGQARIFVVWNRVVTPNGLEVALHSAGTDPLGRAGIKGRVNNHFWQIFGTSALLSVIGTGVGTVGVSTSDEYNSLAAYREEVANSFRDSSSQVLDRYIDIPPTIKIKQGTSIKVLVARDLDFSGAARNQVSSQNSWVIRP